jgi:hypothetical protein
MLLRRKWTATAGEAVDSVVPEMPAREECLSVWPRDSLSDTILDSG